MSDWQDFLKGSGLDFSASLAKGRNLIGNQTALFKFYGEQIPGQFTIDVRYSTPIENRVSRRLAGTSGVLGCTRVTPASIDLGFGSFNPFSGAGFYRLYYWVRGVMPLWGWGTPWEFIEGQGWGFQELHGLVYTPPFQLEIQNTFPTDEVFSTFTLNVVDPPRVDDGPVALNMLNLTPDATPHGSLSGSFSVDRVVEFSVRKPGSGPILNAASLGIRLGSFSRDSTYGFHAGGIGPGDYIVLPGLDFGTILYPPGRYTFGFMWENTAEINPDLLLGGGKHITASDMASAGGIRNVCTMEVMFLGVVPDTAIRPFRVTPLTGH